MRKLLVLTLLTLVLLASCGAGTEQSISTKASKASAAGAVRLVKVGNFSSPLYVAAPPGDTGRIFVVEQGGRIFVVKGGKRVSRPFLDISGKTEAEGERGLLSMAFAPDYAKSRKFYVDYTDNNGNTRIVEYRASKKRPNRALQRSARQLLFIRQPFENHNGGQLQFGPDGYLYIGMGDGGSGDDPGNRAQSLKTLLGKLLRIDPNRSGKGPYTIPKSNPFYGQGGRKWEIYSYGLRNPWRFSFDRKTRDLYIGDVGQDRFEEIDFTREGDAKGANFGWPAYEGRSRERTDVDVSGDVKPVLVTGRESGQCSITGGYVVRDPGLTSLAGRYLYGDFCEGTVRSFKIEGGDAKDDRSAGLHVDQLSSFGEDASGRIYATSLNGPVYRLAGS